MPSLFDLHKTQGQGKTVLDPSQSILKQLSALSEVPTLTDNPSEDSTTGVDLNVPGVLRKADFSKYPLIPFTDNRLLSKPPAFDFEKPNYLEYAPSPLAFAEALYERMLALNGIGLSANQIGIPLRVFVFGDRTTRHFVFNPEVIGVSEDMVLMEERCLSFPGFALTLNRPAKAGVSFQTETGGWFVATLDKLPARVFLHEYDHMEGITFLHWASQAKRDWEIRKVNKKLKKMTKQKKMNLKPKPLVANKETHG
jgi:peptide deformylase